jgi:site-specific DNA recombinase
MMIQMLGVFAEFERATLIDRVVAGMERKAARGEWHGGRMPYGYEGQTNDLRVVEEEAKVVRRIFELCADGSRGAKAIAMSLNAEGLRTRTGGPWGPETILDILRNPVYVGDVWFRGVTHPGNHAAIIDRKTFAKCAVLLEERGESQRLKATHSSGYDFAGFGRCNGCRKRMVGRGEARRHASGHRATGAGDQALQVRIRNGGALGAGPGASP